jgi:hypothetical protein
LSESPPIAWSAARDDNADEVKLASSFLSTAALLLLAAVSWAASPSATPRDPLSDAGVQEFAARVQDYVALQRRLLATIPPVQKADDPEQIAAYQRALARAIRDARSSAKPGDVFVPAVVPHFRSLVKADLKQRTSADAGAVREEVPQVAFRVNDLYPDAEPLATVPPMLLARMPRLPEEVEYRFLKRHLILLDNKARLIVDYIPGLLPEEHP